MVLLLFGIGFLNIFSFIIYHSTIFNNLKLNCMFISTNAPPRTQITYAINSETYILYTNLSLRDLTHVYHDRTRAWDGVNHIFTTF